MNKLSVICIFKTIYLSYNLSALFHWHESIFATSFYYNTQQFIRINTMYFFIKKTRNE